MKRRPRNVELPQITEPGHSMLIIVLTISMVVLALLRFVLIPFIGKSKEPARLNETDAKHVSQLVLETLAEYGIQDKWIAKKKSYFEVSVPTSLQLYDLYASISEHLEEEGAQVLKCTGDQQNEKIDLIVGKNNKAGNRFLLVWRPVHPAMAGVAAIIIDDFGYGYDNVVKEFILFPKAITLSVIPGLKESQQIAREAQLAQKEVLIHMPMEPLEEKYSDEGYTLLTGQDPGLVRLRIRRACADLPMAVGMNNHQGSKATADEELMKVALSEMKAAGKFFIDSRTNSKSVALSVARSLRLRAAENQVFLDVEDDEGFIAEQLKKMADLAASRGKVIAIGHVRKKTLSVLKSELPTLEARGIEFVFVSQVL
jgi:polysaccharide deacetylase 2 family uncharacterized protein YibQ